MQLKIISIIASIIIILGIIAGAFAFSSSASSNNPASEVTFDGIEAFTPVSMMPGQQQTNMSYSYGCEIYGGLICRPAETEFDSFLATARVSKVHTVATNNTEYVQGFPGDDKALRLHAYNEDFVVVRNTAGLNNTEFSVSFWAKRDPNAFNYGQIVSYTNRPATEGWYFDTGQPNLQSARFVIANTSGVPFPSADIALADQHWVHVVGTFDGQIVRTFQNGTLLSEAKFVGTYRSPAATIPVKIGNAAYCYSCAPWGGEVNDVIIFNRALTNSEVEALYDGQNVGLSGAVLNQLNRNVVGHWTLDETVEDSSQYHRSTEYISPAAGMVFAPDGRLFFTEKNTGNIRIIDKDDKVMEKPFATVPNLNVAIMYGLLGITLDPDYKTNHYVYAYYSTFERGNPAQAINRVVRYTDTNNEGTDMKVILDHIPAYNAFHSGGALAFGPDGKLYVSVGEGNEASFAVDPNTMLGKVLRINKDGSIPDDNPDPNSPVFSIGHRNVFGIGFDPTKLNSDGEYVGIATENGDRLYDEVNILHKAGNYGWPLLQAGNQDPYLTNNKSIKPARTYLFPISPTQVIFYTGDKFPELKGMFLYGSYNNARIYAIRLDDSGQHIARELNILPADNLLPVMAIAQSPSGDIYYGGHEIYKLSSISVDREQLLYPVHVNMSSSAEIKQMSIIRNTMVLNIDPHGKMLSSVTVKVPKPLIDGFTSATAVTKSASGSSSQPEDIAFTVRSENLQNYNIVTLPVNSDKEMSITLTALRVANTA